MQICEAAEVMVFNSIKASILSKTGKFLQSFSYLDGNKAAREISQQESLTPSRICTASSHLYLLARQSTSCMPLRYILYDCIQYFPICIPKIYFKHVLLCILTGLLKSFWLHLLFLFKCLNCIFSIPQAPKGNITFLYCQPQKGKIKTYTCC